VDECLIQVENEQRSCRVISHSGVDTRNVSQVHMRWSLEPSGKVCRHDHEAPARSSLGLGQ
jgi:hypothetical protein